MILSPSIFVGTNLLVHQILQDRIQLKVFVLHPLLQPSMPPASFLIPSIAIFRLHTSAINVSGHDRPFVLYVRVGVMALDGVQ